METAPHRGVACQICKAALVIRDGDGQLMLLFEPERLPQNGVEPIDRGHRHPVRREAPEAGAQIGRAHV